MRSGSGSLLRKSYAIVALLAIAIFGLMAAPARTTQGGYLYAGDPGTLGVPLRPGTLIPPTFGANVRANSDSTVLGQHEPSLAVSRTDPNVVVVANKDYRDQNVKRVWIEVSRDGGQTWPTQLHMPGLPTTSTESDPVVIARDDGRIYVSCLTRGNEGIFITWTDDAGLTWQPSVPVVQNQSNLQDKDWFAIDNNPTSPFYHRMYMAWAPGGVVSSYSTNGGLNWSAPQQIPNSGPSALEYPYPVVAPNGDVFLFHLYNWTARGTSPSIVKVVKSTDGGVSWSQPVNVATIYQPLSPPRAGDNWRFFSIISAAADPSNNNRLYAAWTDNRNLNTNGTEVFYSASTDHGSTWGPITRLSHDPTGVVRDHITPMITVGADGRVHAFWLDRRLDPSNRFFDAWYSSSTDGGATWDPDTRVSTTSQDLNVGFPPGSGNAAGDYWGLDTVGNVVYVAWNDTRSGDQDILVSRGVFGGGTVTPSPVPPSPTRTATAIASSTATIAPPTATTTIPPVTAVSTGTVVSPSATSTAADTAVSASSTSTVTMTASATSSVTPTPVCLATWRLMPGPGAGDLTDVAAIASDNVWALNGTDIFHWNGTVWSVIPHPTGTGYSLMGIEAVGPDDIWVVGSQPGSQLLLSRTLIEHWDGTQWSVVDSPNAGPSVNDLRDVVAIAPDDVWAVGMGGSSAIVWSQILHWDGISWSDYSMHGAALTSVSATGPSDVWAVGGIYAGMPQILHWDGTAWQGVSSPKIGVLNVVEAIAPDDVWAASDYWTFVHWDGTQWSVVSAPTGVSAISGMASDNIWAGGNALQHWDGVQWEIDTSAPPATVRAMSAVAANEIWAVGDDGKVLRYTDQRYADVPPDNTFYNHVNFMTCLGIMSGYECGGPGEPCGPDNLPYFRPNNDITRGQLSKIVSNAAGFSEDPGAPVYADVSEENVFYPFIQRLTHRFVVSGYPCGGPGEPCDNENTPYFRPFANATRGQISKIVANAAGVGGGASSQTFEDVSPFNTFYTYIERLANLGVMSGYPCGTIPEEPCIEPDNRPYFRPNANATRGQTSKIVANTFFPECCGLLRWDKAP